MMRLKLNFAFLLFAMALFPARGFSEFYSLNASVNAQCSINTQASQKAGCVFIRITCSPQDSSGRLVFPDTTYLLPPRRSYILYGDIDTIKRKTTLRKIILPADYFPVFHAAWCAGGLKLLARNTTAGNAYKPKITDMKGRLFETSDQSGHTQLLYLDTATGEISKQTAFDFFVKMKGWQNFGNGVFGQRAQLYPNYFLAVNSSGDVFVALQTDSIFSINGNIRFTGNAQTTIRCRFCIDHSGKLKWIHADTLLKNNGSAPVSNFIHGIKSTRDGGSLIWGSLNSRTDDTYGQWGNVPANRNKSKAPRTYIARYDSTGRETGTWAFGSSVSCAITAAAETAKGSLFVCGQYREELNWFQAASAPPQQLKGYTRRGGADAPICMNFMARISESHIDTVWNDTSLTVSSVFPSIARSPDGKTWCLSVTSQDLYAPVTPGMRVSYKGMLQPVSQEEKMHPVFLQTYDTRPVIAFLGIHTAVILHSSYAQRGQKNLPGDENTQYFWWETATY